MRGISNTPASLSGIRGSVRKGDVCDHRIGACRKAELRKFTDGFEAYSFAFGDSFAKRGAGSFCVDFETCVEKGFGRC